MASCVIVDDEADTRFVVRHALEGADDTIAVVGEASSGDEAVTCWRELHPDVIVLDQRMPGRSGLEIAEEILSEDPDQLIVLFTGHPDAALARRAREIGIRVCLTKRELDRLRSTVLELLGIEPPDSSE